jgi:hypothetical protein
MLFYCENKKQIFTNAKMKDVRHGLIRTNVLCIYISMYTHVYTYVYSSVYIYVTYVYRMYVHPYVFKYMHTYIHTYIHTTDRHTDIEFTEYEGPWEGVWRACAVAGILACLCLPRLLKPCMCLVWSWSAIERDREIDRHCPHPPVATL